MSQKKRIAYAAEFKFKVIVLAKQSTKFGNMAACHFTINDRQVREQRKKKLELSMVPVGMKASQCGKALFPELEAKLEQWVMQLAEQVKCNLNKYWIRAPTMLKDPAFHPLKSEFC